jgi:hypothetical protein
MEKQEKIKIEIPKEILDLLSEKEKKKIKSIENDEESDRNIGYLMDILTFISAERNL